MHACICITIHGFTRNTVQYACTCITRMLLHSYHMHAHTCINMHASHPCIYTLELCACIHQINVCVYVHIPMSCTWCMSPIYVHVVRVDTRARTCMRCIFMCVHTMDVHALVRWIFMCAHVMWCTYVHAYIRWCDACASHAWDACRYI